MYWSNNYIILFTAAATHLLPVGITVTRCREEKPHMRQGVITQANNAELPGHSRLTAKIMCLRHAPL